MGVEGSVHALIRMEAELAEVASRIANADRELPVGAQEVFEKSFADDDGVSVGAAV